MNIEIRPAIAEDTVRAQELRKIGWQDNYVNPETGVTKEILVTELAKLPVPQADLDYYLSTLEKEGDKDNNLVAILDSKVVGVVFYETLENGNGYIGVFVDPEYRGQGIGSILLKELVDKTTNDLEVIIFAKNRSRGLYKKFGFVEEGPEENHIFREGVYLPTQKLVLRR